MDNGRAKIKKDCQYLCRKIKTASDYEPEVHKFRNGRGDAVITAYHVFPGIDLAFYSVHMDGFFFGAEGKGDFMEICHCREGRMEQEREKGSVYIMPGDLSVMQEYSRWPSGSQGGGKETNEIFVNLGKKRIRLFFFSGNMLSLEGKFRGSDSAFGKLLLCGKNGRKI